MRSPRIVTAAFSALCLVAASQAVASATASEAQPDQTELGKVAACLEHVLNVWPKFNGGGEELARQVPLLAEVEGDHSACEGLSTDEGGVRLSGGEVVKLTWRKSDIRCECLSVWVPHFILTAGEETIVVSHPGYPKDCNEVCPEKGAGDK